MCCASAGSSVDSTCQYEITAIALTNDSPSAANRVPSPSTRKTENTSSPNVPRAAATPGDSSGTWYSSWNSDNVTSQSRILVSPDRKKTFATYTRMPRSTTCAPAFSTLRHGVSHWTSLEPADMSELRCG